MLDKDGYRHQVDIARGLVSEPPGLAPWQEAYAIDMDVLLAHIEHLERIIDGFLVEWEPRSPTLRRHDGSVSPADLPRILAQRAGVDGTNRQQRWQETVRQANEEAKILAAAERQKAAARRG